MRSDPVAGGCSGVGSDDNAVLEAEGEGRCAVGELDGAVDVAGIIGGGAEEGGGLFITISSASIPVCRASIWVWVKDAVAGSSYLGNRREGELVVEAGLAEKKVLLLTVLFGKHVVHRVDVTSDETVHFLFRYMW